MLLSIFDGARPFLFCLFLADALKGAIALLCHFYQFTTDSTNQNVRWRTFEANAWRFNREAPGTQRFDKEP
jgi:hypothetical protein